MLEPRAKDAAQLASKLESLLAGLAEWRPLLDGDLPGQFSAQAEAMFAQEITQLILLY